jgi:hypothetical protein
VFILLSGRSMLEIGYQRWEVNKAKLFEVEFIMKSRKLGRSFNAFHRNVDYMKAVLKLSSYAQKT